MRRLVYTPKVEVYIKADTGVYDLSPYVTACTVDRKVNQVSTATVTFRNPHQMFTENTYQDPISKKTVVGPVFHPMDPIVIVMTRLRDRPIQVFTGFCDTTPYLQLHPGTVTLQASCTLKRLTATYWDPGLPFMQDWLVAHGWAEGTITNGGSNGIINTKQTKNQGNGKPRVNDAGLGRLLYDVLNEIGGWHDKAIYIEPLPDSIITMISNLYDRDKDASQQSESDFQALLHTIIGSAGLGGGGGNGTNTTVVGGQDGTLSGPISQPEGEFSVGVAKSTGLDPRTVGGWVLAESGNAEKNPDGNYNYLNIGPHSTDPTYQSLDGAISATNKLLHGGLYDNILASAGKTIAQQAAAIYNSPWCAGGCYGGPGAPTIVNLANQLKFTPKPTQTKPPVGHRAGP